MLTDKDLKELPEYKGQAPVLSVYLNTDPTVGSADAHKLHLRSMLQGGGPPRRCRAGGALF